MPKYRIGLFVALLFSLAFHAAFLAPWAVIVPPVTSQAMQVDFVKEPVRVAEYAVPKKRMLPAKPILPPQRKVEKPVVIHTPAPGRQPAFLPAPSPPTAEEWALASTYKPRNSKRYRNAWGQQVRSMMGTAVEGPDQGQVRFRIEIAPDGRIVKVEELWSTSVEASKLAWNAIRSLPPLPPTPTGKPLVFEQTISFLPYETGWPPSYRLDCLPEPQEFRSPFVWNGVSPEPASGGQREIISQSHRPPPPDECIPDSTADSIEEEDRELKRQMDQWRWGR